MKKAQVTTFLIIGLVLVAAFAFTFFMVRNVTDSRLQRDVDVVYKQLLETTALKKFVTKCAKESSLDALHFAGVNGSLISGESVEYYNSDLGLELKAQSLLDKTVPNVPPKYPCFDDSIGPAYCKFLSVQDNYKYYYGSSKFTNLCKTNLCEPEISGSDSLQEYMEGLIADHVEKCVEFDKIQGFNSTFNITKGNVSVNIEFGKVAFTATVNYPIMFHIIGHEPVERIANFSVQEKARLYYMYRCAETLVAKDAKQLNFDVLDKFEDTNFCSIFTNYSIFNSGFDDVVVIYDDYYLDGLPYFFQFAIENRYPILDYISYNPTEEYDFVVFVNETLVFDLNAEDPDSDSLSFKFDGWKDIELNQALNDGKAELELNEGDVGSHNVTVYVNDGQLTDWQRVRIYVDDALKLNISGCNIYGYECNLTSIEDPYWLYAKNVDEFSPGNVDYVWKVDNTLLHSGLEDSLLLPDVECSDLDCLNPLEVSSLELGLVNLSVEALGVESSFMIDVKQCLPFINGAKPYPFGPAWLSDHTCCENFNVVDDTKVCYSTEDMFVGYSEIELGDASKSIKPVAKELQSMQTEFNLQNDVLKRSFTVNCDGLRGNICAGNANEIWEIELICPDLNEGESERCVYAGEFGSEVLVPSCKNVPEGQTFELLNGLVDLNGEEATGVCNKVEKCTNGISYSSSGSILGVATCDGDGGCNKVEVVEDCNEYDRRNYPNKVSKYCPLVADVQDQEELFDGLGSKDVVTTTDYYCDDGCNSYNLVDLDKGQEWCDGCLGSSWVAEGETSTFGEYGDGSSAGDSDLMIIAHSLFECCGDDLGEYKKKFESDVFSGSVKQSCCNDINDCVYNKDCFSSGLKEDVDSNGDNDYCFEGSWFDCKDSVDCPKIACYQRSCSNMECVQTKLNYEQDLNVCDDNNICVDGGCVSIEGMGGDDSELMQEVCSMGGFFVREFNIGEAPQLYGCCDEDACWAGTYCTSEDKYGFSCIEGLWS